MTGEPHAAGQAAERRRIVASKIAAPSLRLGIVDRPLLVDPLASATHVPVVLVLTRAPHPLLISEDDPDLGVVAAFEELIGSHGGLGGPQTRPLILDPVECELDEDVELGGPAIHRNIRRWLDSIGIPLGKVGVPADEAGAGATATAEAPVATIA